MHELRTVVLENRFLRVVVFPEAGAKIWQITYKALNTDLLWNNPAVPPRAQPLYSGYDDNWSGGWDELFPNDEACSLKGLDLPDHGELWTGAWSTIPSGTNALKLRFVTPLTRFIAEKELILQDESPVLKVRYKLTNMGSEPFQFLWKLHPAFAVTVSHRIDFPPMNVLRELDFPGTLGDALPVFPWPYAALGDRVMDLRPVQDASSHALHFFYGTGYTDGWCGVTDRKKKLAAGLHFDPKVFSSCWLFATYGGWRDLNVAVLEPATGYPFQMEKMIANGQARTLSQGESIETEVVLSVREGLRSIGGVGEDGTITPGDET
ncbi:MAG: DUF5107 domain-containing protein [Acidobacteriota bacterium]|nr:DUF5107 domain-containing protein [Acidobacteriota bacterium]